LGISPEEFIGTKLKASDPLSSLLEGGKLKKSSLNGEARMLGASQVGPQSQSQKVKVDLMDVDDEKPEVPSGSSKLEVKEHDVDANGESNEKGKTERKKVTKIGKDFPLDDFRSLVSCFPRDLELLIHSVTEGIETNWFGGNFEFD
jgi:hypothetical protein